MFQVGAINPNTGNDRRKQLIDQLVQQLAQARSVQAQQNPAPGGMGFSELMRKRQQTLLPSAPTRTASAGRVTSNAALTGMNHIPAGLAALLGPGGAGRAGAGYHSSAPGIAVERIFNPGRGPASAAPAAIPAAPAAPSQLSPSMGAPARIPEPAPIQAANPIPPGYSGVDHSNAVQAPSAPPVSINSGGAQLRGLDARMAGPQPTAHFSTPSGLIPVGNGIFVNPATGQIFGGSISSLPISAHGAVLQG